MKCPGQDMRYWKPGDIFDVDCPHCGNKVEFFKDEATRKCSNCKNKIVNPRMNFGCAGYCQFAAQCLGDLGPELLAKRNDFFKDRLAIEVKKLLGTDFRKVAHMVSVANRVEEIARTKKIGPALALCVAYLHIFFESQDEQVISTGQKTVRDILERLCAGPELTGKILSIIDSYISGEVGDSSDAKLFYDAHLLVSSNEK